MKKYFVAVLAFLLVITSMSFVDAANTWSVYGNSGWVRLNTTGQNGTYVCLADGSGCPTNVSGGGNGTVTSITATGHYLTGGTITTTGTIAVNTSAFCLSSGVGCVASGAGTTAMWLTNLTASGITNWSFDRSSYVNFTMLNAQNNLSLAQIVANIQNWSADRSSYVNFTMLNAQNNLSLAQIIANIGNWSLDRINYVNFTMLNFQNNLSLGQISANIGNWSADKSTYLQNNTHANFTKFSINSSPQETFNGSCWNRTGATSQWLVC